MRTLLIQVYGQGNLSRILQDLQCNPDSKYQYKIPLLIFLDLLPSILRNQSSEYCQKQFLKQIKEIYPTTMQVSITFCDTTNVTLQQIIESCVAVFQNPIHDKNGRMTECGRNLFKEIVRFCQTQAIQNAIKNDCQNRQNTTDSGFNSPESTMPPQNLTKYVRTTIKKEQEKELLSPYLTDMEIKFFSQTNTTHTKDHL